MRYLLRSMLLLFIISWFTYTYAQIPVGYVFDVNGRPMHGYYDALNYKPKEQISIVHNSDSFEKGYYYDNSGARHEGLILFGANNKIRFKRLPNSKKQKLELADIKSIKLGLDSFFVTYNLKVQKGKSSFSATGAQIVQFIAQFKDYELVKHYYFSTHMDQSFINMPPIIETYQIRKKRSDKWISFPKKEEKFKSKALSYFWHIPYLEKTISEGILGQRDMFTIAKIAEYYDKYQKEDKIYFNEQWQEVLEKNDAVFYANIVNLEDSIWTVEYFNRNHQKLYQGQFSSFYPHRKNGDFIAYYTDGQTRKIDNYKNNGLRTSSTFYRNGNPHYVYSFKEETIYDADYSTYLSEYYTKYLKWKSRDGINMLDTIKNDIKQIVFYDSIKKRDIIHEFQGQQLLNAYYIKDEDRIYFRTEPNNKVNIRPLQRKFKSFMADKELSEIVEAGVQGTILVRAVIDKKGYVMDYQVLNNLHAEFDTLINAFLRPRFGQDVSFKHRFKKFKVNKTVSAYEVVIPISFSINKFYRSSYQYNYWMDHHWLFQQQMMNMPTPTPPRF